MLYLTTLSTHFIYGYMASVTQAIQSSEDFTVYTYFCAHVHLRLKPAVMGTHTHLSGLGCLSRTVSKFCFLLDVSEGEGCSGRTPTHWDL